MAAFPHNLPGTQEVPKIWHLDQANQSHYPMSYASRLNLVDAQACLPVRHYEYSVHWSRLVYFMLRSV
jgi:hypothetical protein